jgi:hypothetical protein
VSLKTSEVEQNWAAVREEPDALFSFQCGGDGVVPDGTTPFAY